MALHLAPRGRIEDLGCACAFDEPFKPAIVAFYIRHVHVGALRSRWLWMDRRGKWHFVVPAPNDSNALERSCYARLIIYWTVVLRQGSMGSMLHLAHAIHIPGSCLQLPMLPCSTMRCGKKLPFLS